MSYSIGDKDDLKINQAHFNNWGRFALKEADKLGTNGVPANSFILKHAVDKLDKNTMIGTYKLDSNNNLIMTDEKANKGYETPAKP
ncbi:MAG: hypothetical protein V4556_00085 [Bacteroidota bacterium]